MTIDDGYISVKHFWFVAMLVAAFITVVAMFWAYARPQTLSLEPDATGLLVPARGFYTVEENPAEGLRYRWSDGDATLLLPNPGGPLLLDLRLLAGPATDQRVELLLDNASYQFTLAPGVRRYRVVSGPHTGEQIALRLRSPTIEVNDRLLGTGLSTLTLRGGGAVPPGVLVALVGGIASAWVLGRWRLTLLFAMLASALLWSPDGWRAGLLYEGCGALVAGALLVASQQALHQRSRLLYSLGMVAMPGVGTVVTALLLPAVVGPFYALGVALAATGCFALLLRAGWPTWLAGAASALLWGGTAVAAPLLVPVEGQIALALQFLGCAALVAALAEAWFPPTPVANAHLLRLQQADWLPLLIVIGASLAIRLPLLAAPDPVGDLEIAAGRVGQLWQRGLAGAYDPPGDYMPLRLYILSGLGWFAAALGEPPTAQLTPLLTVLIKIPQLLADLLTPVLIFLWSKRWLARRRAALVAALYTLAPPVWINVAWWGQVDALLMLPMLLTVILFDRAGGRISWLFWVLALLIKPQAIILAPLIFIVTLRHYGSKGLLEGGAVGAGVAGLAILPLALAGQLGNLLTAYTGSVGRFPRATAGAYNIWYLWLGPIARDTDRVLGSLSARTIGFLLLGVAVALVCGALLFRNNEPGRARAAALLALAFFCLPTQIHERYMFLSLAFLTLCIAPHQRWLWLWLWAVSAATLNILAELSGFVPLIDATLGRSPLRYVIAAGNMVALCCGLWMLYGQKREEEGDGAQRI